MERKFMTDSEMMRRLERLERDNRRLKRLGALGLATVLAAVIVYAVSCSSGGDGVRIKSSAERIAAREFDLVDADGKVRAQINVNCAPATSCRPEINLLDQDGRPATSIGAGTFSIAGEKGQATLVGDHLQFSVASAKSQPLVTAEIGSGSGHGGLLSLVGNSRSYVTINANSPGIEIQDSQGYVMNLGSVALTTVNTGQTSPTTADSIVMFGNDKSHHLIWRAP
jgi:hypothetical protein